MMTFRAAARAFLPLLLALMPAGVVRAQDPADWTRRQPVSVANPGATLTDHQVHVVLDDGNFDFQQARPDGGDLLFCDPDGTVFHPYWIETWDPAAGEASVWVRLPELPGGETTVVVMLTGNPAATARSDGAATFPFYSGFEELAGGQGLNAPAPLVTPTYDGSGQVVHPDVVHVPGGWNGYAYWMGMTPYPNGNDDYENPSILASADNATWVVPPGATNPLEPEPDGHNDDVDMLLVDGVMVMYYNETNNDGSTYMKRLVSTDGVTWSPAQTVVTLPNYVMSPTVIHDGAQYVMWYVRSPAGCTSPYQDFYRRTSGDGIAWGPEQACTIDHPGRVLWHLDVQRVAGAYTMAFISYPDGSSCGNTQLYWAESSDGVAWIADPEPLLTPGAGSWDDGNVYRASHLFDGTFLRLWYSAMSSGGQWRVGYTEGELADFFVEPPGTWSELHGDVAATTDHPRTGSHGLREIGGAAYPQVFGTLPGGDVCVNVWYLEEMSSATNFMALLRLWDADTSTYPYHCIGTGVWTGASTSHYSTHTEGFSYTPTALPRTAGWRLLSIAPAGDGYELRVDGTPVATLDVLDPALVDRFSVEGYRGGTGWFDDAYVRRHALPEPTVTVGPPAVSSARAPAAPATLEGAAPNPFNPGTVVAFRLDEAVPVELAVFDLRGRRVRTLLAETRGAGRHEVAWDGRDGRGGALASGTYLLRLRTPTGTVAGKLMLVK